MATQLSVENSYDFLRDVSSGKTVIPKVANEIKLINFGKILENNKTVGQCRAPFGELTGGVMVMHVVVQPSMAKTKAGTFRLYCSIHYIKLKGTLNSLA